MNRYRDWLPALGALLVATILRALLLSANVVPFNSDEGVVGLMARHILQGERPVFFYGQAYMGSLDAWLVAGAFALLGQSVLVIRLVQTALYLGLIFTTYLLGLKIYKSTWMAGAAALFLALPSVLVTLYTTASLGDYGETLLIGNLLLLLALNMSDALFPWLMLGLLGGLGFWTFPLIGVYLLPVVGYLLARQFMRWRALVRHGWPKVLLGWGLFGLGFGVGAAPWLWFTLTQGAVTLSEMFGAAIAGASPAQPVFAALGHFYNFMLFGLTVIFGMRPPWSAQFLALPLMPFALVIYTALTLFIFRRSFLSRDAARPGRLLLVSCVLALVALFVFTPFGADPSGRYFLPLMPLVALFLADLLWPRREWLHHPSLPPACCSLTGGAIFSAPLPTRRASPRNLGLAPK